MSSPSVTVCIPAYNNGRYLGAAIESVLAQHYEHFQLLIIDDCSRDDSREIVAGYAARDRRIELHVNEVNRGMVANWNACLRLARGEYVQFLFGDDLLASPDALQKMAATLAADSSLALVASARYLIDERSQKLGVSSGFAATAAVAGERIISRCLLTQKNLIGEPSVVMFRRALAARGFDPDYSQFVDLEMWFHLLEQGLFAYLSEPLASFRVHGEQQTRKNVQQLLHVEEMLALMRVYAGKPYVGLGTATLAFLRYHQLYRLWKAANNGGISREEAVQRIARYCSPHLFRTLIPVYKVMNPIWKLRCRAGLP